MNQDVYSKSDIFILEYNAKEENTIEYMLGKSITENEERCVAIIKLNPNIEDFLEDFNAMLTLDCSIDVKTLAIDYRLLNNETAAILKRVYQNGYIAGIRIIPDNATLTKELASLFQDEEFRNLLVAVDNVEKGVDIESLPIDLRAQEGLCKIEHVAYLKDEEVKDHVNIHVTRKLNRSEIAALSRIIKKNPCQKILVDFYDPAYYKDFIEELNLHDIAKDIVIIFLANPLHDEKTCYEDLNSAIPNRIKINYNTSDELIEAYQKEPYSEGINYYSDIESSGYISISKYNAMMELVDELTSTMEEKKLSPLEKVTYLHDELKKRASSTKKVITQTNVANIYSIILRKAGIQCFTYGAGKYHKNILRVTDKKYGVDNIALIDARKDIFCKENRNCFENFLVPISNDLQNREPEIISIPTSLSIASPDYYAYIDNSNPIYATDSLGYAIVLLQKMGLSHGNAALTGMELREFYKSALATSPLKDRIPYDKIVGAVLKVRETLNEYQTQQDEYKDHEEISDTLKLRGNQYYNAPAIKLLGPPEDVADVDLYQPTESLKFTETMEKYDGASPRKRYPTESALEYRAYLKDYYNMHFYEESNLPMLKEEEVLNYAPNETETYDCEYEIDDIPFTQIVMYRDIHDSGRVFANKKVFERFTLTPPNFEVVVSNGEKVYEMPTDAVVDILNNANNGYSPYMIKFLYIELENRNEQHEEVEQEKNELEPEESLEDEALFDLNEESKTVDSVTEILEKPKKFRIDINEINDATRTYENMVYANFIGEKKVPFEEANVSQKEEVEQLDSEEDYIPGTNFKKPRQRMKSESDEEYVCYLEDYYEEVFGEKEDEEDSPIFDLLNDNLIPGTNFERPRVRGIYETDEEYVTYLEDYYNSVFGLEENTKKI